MSVRALSIVLLAVAAVLTAGIVTAVAVSVARWWGWPTGVWLAPSALFASTMVLFFLGRRHVLPPRWTATSGRALSAITIWNSVAMLLTAVAVLGIQKAPYIGALGGGAILIVWLLAMVAVGNVLTDRDRRGYSQ